VEVRVERANSAASKGDRKEDMTTRTIVVLTWSLGAGMRIYISGRGLGVTARLGPPWRLFRLALSAKQWSKVNGRACVEVSEGTVTFLPSLAIMDEPRDGILALALVRDSAVESVISS